MYETIRFPTADSDHATTVADHAIDIAATDDATLHVLSVVDERAFLVLDGDRIKRVRDDLEATAHAVVDDAATRAADRGLETTTAVDSGNPAECILESVAATDVELIVMGSSGDEYERNVVGSVSQRVVPEAPVPVTTVGRSV